MNYSIAKHKYDGWQAKKKIISDNLEISITIESYKKYSYESTKIIAFVCVGHIDNGFIKHTVFSDYSKRFLILDNVKRITSKVIESCTTTFYKESETIVLAEIKEFYKQKESELIK